MFAPSALLLGLATAVAAQAPDLSAIPRESFWLQHWWSPATETWTALGLMSVRRDGTRVVAEPLGPTYVSRSVSLPERPLEGGLGATGLRLTGTFGKRQDAEGRPTDQDLVLEFRLTLEPPRTLLGAVSDGEVERGRTRLTRLDDAELLHQLDAIGREWQIERRTVEAGLAPIQDAIAFLQRQLDDDRALGRVGLTSQSTMVLDDLRNRLAVEELRHQQTLSGERAIREMRVRLGATLGDIAPTPASIDLPLDESFWRQEWRASSTDDWLALGVLGMHGDAATFVAVPLAPTYTHRGSQLPEGPLRGRRTATTWTMAGRFAATRDDGQAQPASRELEFRLRPTDDARTLVGGIFDGGSQLGETRFTRLADRRELLAELSAADDRWAVEIAVVKGTIPSLRDQVHTLERREQWERQGGSGGIDRKSVV